MKPSVIVLASLAALAASHVRAGLSAEEIKQLGGPKLTAFGAERAANADGSIPAYEGGGIKAPASYQPGSGRYPDPFAAEKPLLRVDAKNVSEHKAMLPAGVVAMVEQYPSFHINVYPSHRTAIYPKWVLDSTVKHASTAEVTHGGDAVKGAYGGIPFPMPKNGDEAMWNFRLRYQPAGLEQRQESYLVDASGRSVFLGRYTCLFANTYYDPEAAEVKDPYVTRQLCLGEAPTSQAGYNLLINYSIDYANFDQLTWVYTPGQRRVRTAPEFSYDTPAANFGGALVYDEVNLFSGRTDRYDLKLLGKREMFVPYNNYALFAGSDATADATVDQKFMMPKHVNPAMVRWEKHRVFVVEATLKQGKRHVQAKRTFYIDEDSWQIVASDGYDQSGKLYRVGLAWPFLVYGDDNAPYISGQRYALHDLTKGEYFVSVPGEKGRYFSKSKLPDMGRFTSSRLAATGVR